jgi:hypothetical protein
MRESGFISITRIHVGPRSCSAPLPKSRSRPGRRLNAGGDDAADGVSPSSQRSNSHTTQRQRGERHLAELYRVASCQLMDRPNGAPEEHGDLGRHQVGRNWYGTPWIRRQPALLAVATFRVNMSPEPVPTCDRLSGPHAGGEDPVCSSQIYLPQRQAAITDPLLAKGGALMYQLRQQKSAFCGEFKSPLTDSNRRPPPYHGG